MQSVGRYRIEGRIGQGAMADVFRAHDENIDRPLAIKVLKAEFRSNAEYVSRFLREAQAAGVMSHPNIVTIYDVGEADGFPYIAMELLQGESLDTILQREGRLPPERVISLGQKLASALAYAHRAGIVHRDIKPSNIMISADWESVKLLDFGIARLAESDREGNQARFDRTQVGHVLGTPRYMSPEQALGLQTDGRTDLFSLGVVLYEAVTGRCAFDGETLATLALRITQSAPEPIVTLASDCPKGLRFIIDKLMAKNPDARFEDGASLAAALRREEVANDDASHGAARRRIPLAVRVAATFGGATALALLLAVSVVLPKQEQALASTTLVSGTSIAKFVANHVALRTVENSALPPGQQDWLPVQAFVTTAAEDPDVRQIWVIDGLGTVRASSVPDSVGTSYRPPAEPTVYSENDRSMTAAGERGLRFRENIEYAGQSFGEVAVVLDRAPLVRAIETSRAVLYGAAAAIFLLVLLISWLFARRLQRPVRVLSEALRDAAEGKVDFRISHRRNDEFGELFDRFNELADTIQAQESASGEEVRLDATMIAPASIRAA